MPAFLSGDECGHSADSKNETDKSFKFQPIEDKAEFKTEGRLDTATGLELDALIPGATLRALHTPGHCNDHVSFLLEEESAMFTGDCVLGAGTTVFNDLALYMRSLQKMRDAQPKTLYPGHGPHIAPESSAAATTESGMNSKNVAVAKLEEYIAHRQMRENQIVAILTERKAVLTSSDIVKALYPSDLAPRVVIAGLPMVRIRAWLLSSVSPLREQRIKTCCCI